MSRSGVVPPYTNQVFVGLWADGINRTPALLFTHNPKFDLSRTGTRRRADEQAKLLDVLAKYGVDPSRIIYEKSQKYYYAESHHMVSAFLDHYKDEIEHPESISVFSDDGRCYAVPGG